MRKLLLSFAAMMLAFVANAQVVFDFDNNYATYFPSLPGVSSGSNDTYVADGEFNEDAVVTVDGVTITIKASAADAKTRNRVWASSPRLRMYNESFTIAAPSHKITSIEFDAHTTNFNVSTEQGELNTNTRQWVGSEASVTFAVAKNTQIKTITVTLDKQVDVIPEDHIANAPEEPYDVTKAFQIIAAGKALDEKVYVKGVISKINEIDTGDYGNATYFISNNGSEEGDQLEIYRGYSLKGEKFTSADEIKVGDVVVVYGNLVDYKGTYEFTTGSQIYSINGVTGNGDDDDKPVYEVEGDGSEDNPFIPTDVQALYGTEKCPADAVWTIGYILGSAKSGTSLNEGEQAATNIAIGDDEGNWIPVQLPNGDIRAALNVLDNPENIGKIVMVYGKIDKYFSVAGIKEVSDFQLEGGEGGDFETLDATVLAGTYDADYLAAIDELGSVDKLSSASITLTGDAEGNVTISGMTAEPLVGKYVTIDDDGYALNIILLDNASNFVADYETGMLEETLAYIEVADNTLLFYGFKTSSEWVLEGFAIRHGETVEGAKAYTATVYTADAMTGVELAPMTTTCYIQDVEDPVYGDYCIIMNLGGISFVYGSYDEEGNLVLDPSMEFPMVLDFASDDYAIHTTKTADGFTYTSQMAQYGPNYLLGLELKEKDATAIKSFAADSKKAEAVYNLQGQRVNAAQKGLVIKNGKKFMVK